MSENKKFILSKEPFIRKADHNENTTVMMRDFMIALFPLIIFAWVKNGLIPYLNDATNFFGMLYPLLLVLVGGLSAFLFEFLWYKFLIKKEDVKISLSKSYPLIPGILLGMIVPLATPLWLVVIGVFFATVIGKLLFGGFGNNIFNPALIGYLFLTYAYFNVITGDNALINASGFFNAKEVADAITTATPMTIFANDRAGAVNQILRKLHSLGYVPWNETGFACGNKCLTLLNFLSISNC
ncbi:MAG: RnfABCDGE type electron transport complex subunit D [Bacilli bacterium]